MKTRFFFSLLLLWSFNTFVSAQGNLPPWLIERAPDSNHVLLSGAGGIYDHAKLDSLVRAYQSGAVFYKFVPAQQSYVLPLDTLAAYDLITISVQVALSGPDNVITLPDLPSSAYNGKIIIVNMDSASEVADTVTVTAAGSTNIVQSDCYTAGRTQQDDTFIVSFDNPKTVVYHVAYQDDYYRQCEGLLTLSDGSVVVPGDTFPRLDRKTLPYQIAEYRLQEYANPATVKDTINKIDRALDGKVKITPSGELRMYYIANRTDNAYIDSIAYYYDVSNDGGITWQMGDTAFFRPSANPDSLDLQLWEFDLFFEDANNWKMYYQAAAPDPVSGQERYRTFLATSDDAGQTWVRQGLVLDVGADRVNDWDGMYAGVRSILKHNGKYWMYYEGNRARSLAPYERGNLKMGVAVSDDGINFTKLGQKGFILEMDTSDAEWETNSMVGYTLLIDSVFVMMYGNNTAASPDPDGGNRKVGIAYSYDGINFTKYSGNPIIDLEDFEGGWNNDRNAFISWTKADKGYYVVTRGDGETSWNNGLYFLGNNWDDFYNAQQGNLYVSNGSASESRSRRNEINFPYTSLLEARDAALPGDQINILAGDYIYTGPYFSDPARASLTKEGYNSIYGPGASIAYNNVSGNSTPLLSDVTPSFLSSNVQKVRVDLRKLEVTGSSLVVPIAYYGDSSVVEIKIDSIISGPSRGWLAQTGAPSFTLTADYGEFNGDIGVSSYTPSVFSDTISQNHTFHIKKLRGTATSTYGTFRGVYRMVQDIYEDSSNVFINSMYDVRINQLILDETNRYDFIVNMESMSKGVNNTYNFIINELVEDTTDIVPSPYGFLGINQAQFTDTLIGSDINLYIGKAVTRRAILERRAGRFYAADTKINIELGDITFLEGGQFSFTPSYLDSCELNIQCKSCVNYSSSAPIIIDSRFTNTDNSDIVISGHWRTSNSPVIEITSTINGRIVLKGFYGKHEGGSPIVSSSVPVTVYVSGAFDLGNSSTDPDVTFVRLKEIGSPNFESSITDNTDASGDITVSHPLGTANINVNVTASGTTLRRYTIHSKTATDFKVRFYDAAGAALGAGTSIDFDVQVVKQ
jgi:hypothetical protein